MSELHNVQNKKNDIRLGLLATTSAFVLAACVTSGQEAVAADRPVMWLEGGWQFESMTGQNDLLVPPLDGLATTGFQATPTAANFLGQGAGGFPSFTDIENVLGHSSGAEGNISFQPKESSWVFNISARYGRTRSQKSFLGRQEIDGEPAFVTTALFNNRYLKTPHYTNYDVQSISNTESHIIVDFKVGRDVGLGLFGEKTESVISVGARYVQMSSASKGHSYAVPAVAFYHVKTSIAGLKYAIGAYHQSSVTLLQRSSSFQALGPSLSWSNTTDLVGHPEDGQIGLDWGANVAVLFGRQKVKINYSTEANLFHGGTAPYRSQHKTIDRTQSHNVAVPNLGGFAALSYRFTNAKLSMGYRADFFFGAMDGGLDTHRSMTTGYHGPYATISIGLGG